MTSKVPLYLDEPPTLLGLRPDEFVIFIVIFVPSFLMNFMFIGILMATLFLIGIKRWRGGKPEGFLIHFVYSKGFPSPVSGVPPSPLYARWYEE